MDLKNMRPEDVVEIVTKGIGSDLEELIYQELREQAENTARKVAKEIADRLACQVQSAFMDPMSMTYRIDLNFNMIDMNSTPVAEVIGNRDAAMVAWKCNATELIGKKLFASK